MGNIHTISGNFDAAISNIESLAEMTAFIKRYPTIIPKYLNQLVKVMDEKKLHTFDINFIDTLVFTNPVMDDSAMVLLELYAMYTIGDSYDLDQRPQSEITESEYWYYAILYLATNLTSIVSKDAETTRVYEKCVQKILYNMCAMIMDYQVDSENPPLVCQMISTSFTLKEIVTMHPISMRGTVMSKLEEDNDLSDYDNARELLSEAYKTVLGLYNHYNSGDKSRTENLSSMLKVCREQLQIQKFQKFFGDMYYQFFAEDVHVVSMEVKRILTSPQSQSSVTYSELSKTLIDFIAFMSENYNIDRKVGKIFVRDVYNKLARTDILANPNIEKAISTVLDAQIPTCPEYMWIEMSYLSKKYILVDGEMSIVERATEGYDRKSETLDKAQTKIYNAYRAYKDQESKVDSQISKMVKSMGKVAMGDTRTEIIEGKQFSAIGLLKKLLGTVALFSLGPIKGAIALVVRYALKKQITVAERRKLISDLEAEIEIITEKIEDAKGDSNRKAKYAMMRTKTELIKARDRIALGLSNDEKSIAVAKSTLAASKGE